MLRRIAALFVDPRGCYIGLDDVDPWDEKRDARLYAGADPVVAHPPCSRWCRLAGLVEARWGHKRGEDGGCFASALATVRRVGGVLEHPAYSDAWAAFGLARPPRSGGWVPADEHGGHTCHIEQGRYGHIAKKATWLYAVRCELPELRWGSEPDHARKGSHSWTSDKEPRAWVGGYLDRSGATHEGRRPRVGKRAAAATPPEFREILIAMARSVR